MRTILVAAQSDLPFLREPWKDLFDKIEEGPVEAVLRGYDISLSGDMMPVSSPPAVMKEGVKLALLCREMRSLRAWMNGPFAHDLLFWPSPLAVIDAIREMNRTLTFSRDIDPGEEITADSIDVIPGGRGIGETLRDKVIGRAAVYALKAGAPIDFGVLR